MAVSGNPAIETIWLRWVPGFCLQKLPLKKPQSKKTRLCLIGNLIPYQTPSSFSTSGFFLYVHFYRQSSASEFNQGHCSPILYGSVWICMKLSGTSTAVRVPRYAYGTRVPYKYRYYYSQRGNRV